MNRSFVHHFGSQSCAPFSGTNEPKRVNTACCHPRLNNSPYETSEPERSIRAPYSLKRSALSCNIVTQQAVQPRRLKAGAAARTLHSCRHAPRPSTHICPATRSAQQPPPQPPPHILTKSFLARHRHHRGLQTLLHSHLSLQDTLPDWLTFMHSLSLSDTQFLKMLVGHPRVFIEGSVFTAGQALLVLRTSGIHEWDECCGVMMAWPPLLACDAEQQLIPLMQVLRQAGCDDEDIRRLVLRSPRILSCSMSDHIQPKLIALQSAGLSTSQLHAVVRSNADSLFLLSNQDLENKINFFAHLGLTKEQFGVIVSRCPAVLATCCISRVKDVWNFVENSMGSTAHDIVQYPRILEQDLTCVVKPRYLFLESHFPLLASPRPRCLELLSTGSDSEFSETLGVPLQQYLEFYNDLVSAQKYGVKLL